MRYDHSPIEDAIADQIYVELRIRVWRASLPTVREVFDATLTDADILVIDGKDVKTGEVVPEEKEDFDAIKKRSRKPPSEGPCKMCKQMKQLNRLLLCYECWLKDKLHKDSGGEWLPGDPHPGQCGCDGPGGCATMSQGN